MKKVTVLVTALAVAASTSWAQASVRMAGTRDMRGLSYVPVDNSDQAPLQVRTVARTSKPVIEEPSGGIVDDVVRRLPNRPVVGSYPAKPVVPPMASVSPSYGHSGWYGYPTSTVYPTYSHPLPVYGPTANNYYFPTYYQSASGYVSSPPVATSTYYPVMTRPEPIQTNLPPAEAAAIAAETYTGSTVRETVVEEEVVETETEMEYERTPEK